MRLTRCLWAFFFVCITTLATAPAGAGVVVNIDTTAQRMTVAVDGVHRYTWNVSTGRKGYATPSGAFRPFRLEPDHYSEEWDNAPMPHSIFFTERGHAIHGSPYTRNLGRAASHGCVRLASTDAATLYSLVERKGLGNTTIIVTGSSLEIARELTPVEQPRTKVAPKTKRKVVYWPRERRRR